MALMKACPRCRQLIPHGMSYCPTCAPLAEAEKEAKQARRAEYLNQQYNRRYNAKRAQEDPKYRRFRNSKPWKVMSKAKLSDCDYKCEAKLPGCKRIACEVHHKAPLKTPEGWERRLDWDNLEAVCIPCHNILDGKTGKRKKDPDILDIREIKKNL